MSALYSGRLLGVCFTVALLASGCVQPPEAPRAAAPSGLPPANLPDSCKVPAPVPGERVLPFDPTQSSLHIYAYRGGRLARLGHNHIVSTGPLWGYVHVAQPFTDSYFWLCIPVATLEVDNPALRDAAGEAFSTPLDASAIAGTRRNLLSEKLLDAGKHPFIIVQGEVSADAPGEVPLRITFTVRDIRTTELYRSRIAVSNQRVTANGQLTLRQSGLGLEPYSALFGALLVRDELEIRYSLVAQR